MSRRLTDHRRGARRRRHPQPYNLFDSYPDDDLDLDDDDDERPTRRLSAWDEVESDDDTFTDSLWNDDDLELDVEVDED